MLAQQLKARLLRRYLLRYPIELRKARFETLSGLKWIQQTLVQIQPDVLPDDAAAEVAEDARQDRNQVLPSIQAQPTYYHQYRCLGTDPLQCLIPLETLATDPSATQCSRCRFPTPLLPGQKIIGKRATYEVVQRLGQRGLGRIYAATETGSGQPVTVKEFLLPPLYFNPTAQETRQRQEAFTHLAGFSLADGRSQDLLVALPLEAIAPVESPQAFLITPQVDGHPTLNQWLALRGGLSNTETKRLLNQVLQTLSFLHQQKFILPLGQLKTGIVHGNLSLNSLLWLDSAPAKQPGSAEEQMPPLAQGRDFFIYLTDFLLWEQLFNPASVDLTLPEGEADLTALGYIAFYALNGAVTEGEQSEASLRSQSHRPAKSLNPRLDAHWPEGVQPQLKRFLRQLMGLEGRFESATAARLALLNLPEESVTSVFAPPDQVSTTPSWWSRYGPYLLMLAGLVALVPLLGLLLKPKAPSFAEAPGPPCCLADVGGLGLGPYQYSSVGNGSWQRLLQVAESPNAAQPNLLSQLAQAQPELQLSYRPSASIEAAIADLQSGNIDFAILPQITPLPPGLTAQTIAYDGLVVFVAFNYAGRDRGLPTALKGKIDTQTLQQLYQGSLANWSRLSRRDLPARAYWPQDPVAIQLFEREILKRDGESWVAGDRHSEDLTAAVFTPQDSHLGESTGLLAVATPSPSLHGNGNGSLISLSLPIGEMLRETIRDFESRGVGSLGFAPLSAVFGQCSIYPLAIATPQGPVQPLVMDRGQPIDPGVDLCDRKGSYGPDGDRFRDGSYPLAYGLAVVYPMDNSRPDIGKRFAELLLTQEGQTLLEAAGFVRRDPDE